MTAKKRNDIFSPLYVCLLQLSSHLQLLPVFSPLVSCSPGLPTASAGCCTMPLLSSPHVAHLQDYTTSTFQGTIQHPVTPLGMELSHNCGNTATLRYLGEPGKLAAPHKRRLIIHHDKVMQSKIAPKAFPKLSNVSPPKSKAKLNLMA